MLGIADIQRNHLASFLSCFQDSVFAIQSFPLSISQENHRNFREKEEFGIFRFLVQISLLWS